MDATQGVIVYDSETIDALAARMSAFIAAHSIIKCVDCRIDKESRSIDYDIVADTPTDDEIRAEFVRLIHSDLEP